jgi:hypothetical protein
VLPTTVATRSSSSCCCLCRALRRHRRCHLCAQRRLCLCCGCEGRVPQHKLLGAVGGAVCVDECQLLRRQAQQQRCVLLRVGDGGRGDHKLRVARGGARACVYVCVVFGVVCCVQNLLCRARSAAETRAGVRWVEQAFKRAPAPAPAPGQRLTPPASAQAHTQRALTRGSLRYTRSHSRRSRRSTRDVWQPNTPRYAWPCGA